MFKRIISTILISSLLLISACAGKSPSPVMIMQYGDDQKSCKKLKQEMLYIQGEIQNLMPKTDKTGKNVGLGVAGIFFIVPWFFMDFKNGEQQEYDAYRQRYNHLANITSDKDCHIQAQKYPSSAEIVAEMEKAKKKQEAEQQK